MSYKQRTVKTLQIKILKFLPPNSFSSPSKQAVKSFISIRFSITVTFELENTSEREQGTSSNWLFSQVKTRLTLQNSE